MAEFRLYKQERLKSRKSIETLFRSGKIISSPPFRLLYRELDETETPFQMAVAVPKKLIKRAVDRNLIKRRVREAYRLSKSIIYDKKPVAPKGVQLVLHYQSREISDFRTINNSIRFLLRKLSDKLE
jgi:ribonuclease P protein component